MAEHYHISELAVPCPRCGGDKGWGIPWDIDRRDGSLIEHWRECHYCDGTGEVPSEPVTEDDLEFDNVDQEGSA